MLTLEDASQQLAFRVNMNLGTYDVCCFRHSRVHGTLISNNALIFIFRLIGLGTRVESRPSRVHPLRCRIRTEV